jgi:hypothetical protein
VLASVERFTGLVRSGVRVHGFYGVVAIDTTLGSSGPHQPVAVVEGLVAKERADVPAVDHFISTCQPFVDLVITLLHAHEDFGLVFE